MVIGAYSLGEILDKEGYNQYIMVGSELTFGGRRVYFTEHGNYKAFDYFTAIQLLSLIHNEVLQSLSYQWLTTAPFFTFFSHLYDVAPSSLVTIEVSFHVTDVKLKDLLSEKLQIQNRHLRSSGNEP